MSGRKEYDISFLLNAQLNGGFGNTFSKAQQEFARLGKEIQSLNRIQSDISSYQKQQTAILNTETKLQNLKQQHDLLQREISETGGSTASLEREKLRLEQRISTAEAALERQKQKLAATGAQLKEAGVDTGNLAQKEAELAEKTKQLSAEQEKAAESAQDYGKTAAGAFEAVSAAIATAGVAAALQEISEAMTEATKASIEFESAMTGVDKTTNLSAEELEAMSAAVKELATEIPITTTELASVMEVAGQLGIAKDDLLDFSTTMSMLGTATTMTADEAATMLAQFANITSMDPSFYDELGSTIVDLGNSYATTEQKIAEMSQGIAASASLAGMSEADMLGLSAAVSSLGIETQMGSTAISRLISTLMTAVETGEDLNEYARIANMSAEDFAQAWGRDAAGALGTFVVGLSDTERIGSSAIVTLTDLGITEARLQRTILSLSNSGDLLSRAIGTANQAWSENNALTNEAEKRYGTTESLLKMLDNSFGNLKVAIGDAYTPALRGATEAGIAALEGITEFVEKNPAVVRAGTAFVGMLAAATTGLTAYTAAAKIAKAVNIAALLTGPTGAVVGAIAGVAALTAGIVGLVDASNEGIPPVKDLTEAAREMEDTMDEATMAFDKTASSTIAAANVADIYISKLEEMEAAGIDTEEETRQYHNTLALLCQVVPELSSYIDLQNNAIEGGTAALRANTEAWRKNALQQAYQEQLTALMQSYSEVLIEAEKNSIGLTKAQYDLEAAEKKHADAIARMEELWTEAEAEAQKMREEYGLWTDATSYLSEEYYQLQNSLYDLSDEMWRAQESIENYEEAIEDGAAAVAAAEVEISLAEEAVRNLTEATDDNAEATAEAARQSEEVAKAISYVTKEAAALAEAYADAYDAAHTSVSGQYALWEEAADVVATSAGDINSALESQVTYWQNYNANLQSLSERSADIAGLSDVIASFADGSAESVNAIAGMASASDEELAAMVQSWKDLRTEYDKTSGSIAELQTHFAETMDKLQSDLADDIEAMNLGAEAAASGQATIQGFIDGAVDMLPQVEAAYGRLAAAAQAALAPGGGNASFTIPAYASGTHSAAPGFAIVGEYGPELVAFNGGEQVIPSPATMALLNGGGHSVVSAQISSRESGGNSRSSPITNVVNFNIEGSASSETVDQLREYSNEIIEAVLYAIEEKEDEEKRTAYR